MYILDLKKEFYEYIRGKHIIIIVHHDIDAICSCRILQTLIRHDSTQYTLIPVTGLNELKTAYSENCEQFKCFVLINCGATIDLVEEFEPPDDIVFFVLDSHRPTDLCNIYSDGQVRLLWTAEDDQNVPEFEDIFRDDDVDNDDDEDVNSDEDSETETEGRAAKRRRLGEEEILNRRERRLWEDKRNKLMFEYSQYSYYAKASAIILFDLAHTLAKDTKELLWFAILALTEQHLMGKIESSQYILLTGNLQLQVGRLTRKHNASNVASSLYVTTEQELKLSLYRHWTVEKSLICSLYSNCKMRLWSRKGERWIQELLADMGLPLVQSRQKFSAMSLQYRNEFQSSLERSGTKFGLDDLTYPSFAVRYGYRCRYGAADMVYIILFALEQAPQTKNPNACFHDALDCLVRPPPVALLSTCLDRAKIVLETCQRVMKAALDQKKIYSTGPFLYYILQEASPDYHYFSRPHALLLLGHYLQHGYCERHGSRSSASAMPLIVSANWHQKEDDADMCIMLGLPPLCENSPKNFFGKAYEQAAERINAGCNLDFFDSSYIRLRIQDRRRFLDTLTVLLS